jgi:hypothetical protein
MEKEELILLRMYFVRLISLIGNAGQTDPLKPEQTDPHSPFQIDPRLPIQIDPLKTE